MAEINLMDKYPRSPRPIEERAALITEKHREIARQFGKDFFDGDRLYGYGGYNYHPRFWQDTVKRFRDHYQLKDSDKILDVGCAKGFMLHDFKELIPNSTIAGIDISEYAIENSLPSVRRHLKKAGADELPYDTDSFDLVISINTVHNLPLEACSQAIREIERVSRKHSYIIMDAWNTEAEHQRMLDWNLTALTYMHVEDWKLLFSEIGYTGDYYWFIAE